MPREKENTDVFHAEEGARGSPFLEVGLNFKVSGQRQLNGAGFQAARGAPLLATHPWPRSQPGTMTRPWGKRQLEPREGFGINSKKSASPPLRPAGSLRRGAKALGTRQRDTAGWQGAGRQPCLQSQRGQQHLDKGPKALTVSARAAQAPPAPAPGCRNPDGSRSGNKPRQ